MFLIYQSKKFPKYNIHSIKVVGLDPEDDIECGFNYVVNKSDG